MAASTRMHGPGPHASRETTLDDRDEASGERSQVGPAEGKACSPRAQSSSRMSPVAPSRGTRAFRPRQVRDREDREDPQLRHRSWRPRDSHTTSLAPTPSWVWLTGGTTREMTLYHHTTPAVAVRIMSERRMVSAAPVHCQASFFGHTTATPRLAKEPPISGQSASTSREAANECVIAVSDCRSLLVRKPTGSAGMESWRPCQGPMTRSWCRPPSATSRPGCGLARQPIPRTTTCPNV